ncbi:hypothetical protein ACSQ67_000558 [Phaseolus vulgaris]
MATKAKESSVVGREKKATSSNPHITTTKRTTKPSTTSSSSTTTTSSIKKPNTTTSDKNIPNYLKPTLTSIHESPSSKHPKTNSPNNNTSDIRRRSLEKPLSPSNIRRPVPRRTSIAPLAKTTIPSKPISDKTSKPPSDAKTRPPLTKKTTPSTIPSTTTRKVVANRVHGSVKPTKTTPKQTKRASRVETEQVKEVTSQEVEVIKVEDEEHNVHEVQHVSETSPDVEYEREIEHVMGLDDSEPSHYQVVDDERVISTVSEAEEEKAKDEEHEVEEDIESNKDGDSNKTESEGEVVGNDKDEGGVSGTEDHNKSENNSNGKEAVEVEKEAVENGEEVKVETTPLKQKLEERKHGKMEAQISNDVIGETTNKLMEARKNKVRAMAGAFQTVIDHQTTK